MAFGSALAALGGIPQGIYDLHQDQYRQALAQQAQQQAQQQLMQRQAMAGSFQTLAGGGGAQNPFGQPGQPQPPPQSNNYMPGAVQGAPLAGSANNNPLAAPKAAWPFPTLPVRSSAPPGPAPVGPGAPPGRIDPATGAWSRSMAPTGAAAQSGPPPSPQGLPQQPMAPPQSQPQGQADPQQTAVQGAVAIAGQVPPQAVGQMDLTTLAQAIERRFPKAPDEVKYMMLDNLMGLASAGAKQQLEVYKTMIGQMNKERGFAQGDESIRETRREHDLMEVHRQTQEKLEKERIDKPPAPQFLTDAGTGTQFTMSPGHPETGQTLSGEKYTPSGQISKMAAGQKTGPLNESQAEYLAKVYQATGVLPPGIARSSAAISQIMNKLNVSDVSPGDFVANMATKKADASSLSNLTKIADAAISYQRVAIGNLEQALALSKNAIPTDLGPWVNRWIMTGQTQFGDENVPPYLTALLTGANEYAKVMSGSTGAAAATEGARREAAQLFSPYYSTGQIDAVVQVAKQEMDRRQQETRGQIEDVKNRLRSAGQSAPGATAPESGTIKYDAQGNRIQ